MGLSCPLGIARFGPEKHLLEDGLHSSLTLQNETIDKTLIIQASDKVKCWKISLLRLILKITSGNIRRRVEGDTWCNLLTKLVHVRMAGY